MGHVNSRFNPDGSPRGFIADTAFVAQTAHIGPKATVADEASVGGWASVEDNAVVRGRAIVKDNATVCGNALVTGNATIANNALVGGHAVVTNEGIVFDSAVVRDFAVVDERGSVFEQGIAHGDSVIRGIVRGCASVGGKLVVEASECFAEGLHTTAVPCPPKATPSRVAPGGMVEWRRWTVTRRKFQGRNI